MEKTPNQKKCFRKSDKSLRFQNGLCKFLLIFGIVCSGLTILLSLILGGSLQLGLYGITDDSEALALLNEETKLLIEIAQQQSTATIIVGVVSGIIYLILTIIQYKANMVDTWIAFDVKMIRNKVYGVANSAILEDFADDNLNDFPEHNNTGTSLFK